MKRLLLALVGLVLINIYANANYKANIVTAETTIAYNTENAYTFGGNIYLDSLSIQFKKNSSEVVGVFYIGSYSGGRDIDTIQTAVNS